MIAARNWTLGFVGTAIAVLACYLWIDRPVALIVHAEFQQYKLFEKLTYIPGAIFPLGFVVFVTLGLSGLASRRLSTLPTVILLAGTSLAVSATIKTKLKFVFGRTWPETWTHSNPSFIRDHVFGFFPFHGGGGYEAFPSGHTMAICSMMVVLWICYPRYRPIYALCIATVAIGLIGANFHFVSDVIAGGFLGSFVAWLVVAVWDNGVHPVRPSGKPQDQAANSN